MVDSSISKFFEKSLKERLDLVADFSGLSQDELKIIEDATGGISYDKADSMIENAIGTFSLPLGIATNFRINDKDYLIPMVILLYLQFVPPRFYRQSLLYHVETQQIQA